MSVLKYARARVARSGATRSNYWPYAPLPSSKCKLEARAGVARSAATRSGFARQWPFVYIAGADRTKQTEKGSIQIATVLNQQQNTARLTVQGFDPQGGQSILIASGSPSAFIFAGTIQRTIQKSVRGNAYKLYDLECVDWVRLLNRRRVTKQYAAGLAANAIVLDLIASFSSGFTSVNVQAGAPTTSGPMLFRGTLLATAFQNVADDVGWHWYVDPTKDVHFYLAESVSQPTTLRPTTTTFDSLDFQIDLSQIDTRVFGVGGGGQTTAPVAIGASSIPVNECGWYSASGGKVLSGANIVTYTGISVSSGPGTLTGVSGVSDALQQGDTCDVFVQVDDGAAQVALAALEGGDGIHEGWVEDARLSQASITAQATTTLNAFKNKDVRGSYQTYDISTRVGRNVTIQIPKRGISATVTTQRVQQRYMAHAKWRYQVDFAAVWSDLVDMITGAVRPAVGGAA